MMTELAFNTFYTKNYTKFLTVSEKLTKQKRNNVILAIFGHNSGKKL